MRRLMAAALLLALAAATAACGGDDDGGSGGSGETDSGAEPRSAYCTALSDLNNQTPTSPEEVDETLRLSQQAAEEAPEEVADSWAGFQPVFEESLETLRDRLSDPENPPDGVTREDAVSQNYATTADVLSSLDGVSGHTQQIRKHARTDCRIAFRY